MDHEGAEEVDWGVVAMRLTVYAYRRLKRIGVDDASLAEDYASEAIRRHFDDTYADWNGEDPLLHHLGSVVNGLVSNLRRKRARRPTHHELDERRAMDGPNQDEDPEEQAGRKELAELALEALRERLDGDDVAYGVIEQLLVGEDRPRAIAAALELDVREVYNANRRLKKHYAAVRAELDAQAAV